MRVTILCQNFCFWGAFLVPFLIIGIIFLANFNSYEINGYEGRLISTYVQKYNQRTTPYVVHQVFTYQKSEKEYNFQNCSRAAGSYSNSNKAFIAESKIILGTVRDIYLSKVRSNTCIDNSTRLYFRNVAMVLLLMPFIWFLPILVIHYYYRWKYPENTDRVVPLPPVLATASLVTPPSTARYYTVTAIDHSTGTGINNNTITTTTTIYNNATVITTPTTHTAVVSETIPGRNNHTYRSIYSPNNEDLPVGSVVYL